MQSNNFSADQIVAGGEIGWDGELDFAAVGVHDIRSPVVSAHEAGLGDLEPVGTRADGGRGVIDLGHIDDGRTIVVAADGLSGTSAVTGLLVHLNSHLGTSSNG